MFDPLTLLQGSHLDKLNSAFEKSGRGAETFHELAKGFLLILLTIKTIHQNKKKTGQYVHTFIRAFFGVRFL